MKNTTIIIIATLMSGLTQANYSIHMPLEQDNRGGLPNNSITFYPDLDTPQEPEVQWDCQYDSATSYWYTLHRLTDGIYSERFLWAGKVTITALNEPEASYNDNFTFDIDGFTYKKGKFKEYVIQSAPLTSLKYEICRKK